MTQMNYENPLSDKLVNNAMLRIYYDENINKDVSQAESEIKRLIRVSTRNDGTRCVLFVTIHKNDSSEMFLYKRAYEVADKLSNSLSATDYKFKVRVLRKGLFKKYLRIKIEIDWEHILNPARVI